MMACSHNFLHFSVKYPEVVRLFTAINFFFQERDCIVQNVHRCSQKFLIFFIQEKSLDDLHNQHTEYLRKAFFCSLLSRKAAAVMTIISDLGTLILKLRAQLLAFPWQHDPSAGHVTHPAHDIMRNTHNVFKEYSTFLFTGEMFREMTFFLRNSSFTVLGTGECVLGSVEYRQLRS